MAYTFKHGDRPLDGYTIQRAVGRGGFGEVYYALSDGGREVALKYLRENPQVELRGVSHCINLKSPHLVSIFDVKKANDGNYVIVMEYCSGPSLQDMLIAEPKGFGPQKAAFFTREIGKGLSYLHDRGIVHRDLKPGNLFYDDGYVKIGDYGLSKFISVSRHSVQTASIGTVHYMAPEIGSGNYSSGIDIYALGVMLYEMLLGKVPFEGSTMAEVLMKHLTAQPELDNLPHPFGDVIRKAMQKDPKDRYQSVDEMVSELLEVETVKKSLAGFSPKSLEGAVRQGANLADSPLPSPNPAPRVGAYPPPPPAYGGFPDAASPLPAKMAKRVDRVSHKIEKKMAKLAGRYPQPVQQDPLRSQPQASPVLDVTAIERRRRTILGLFMALAMAIAMGVVVANTMGGHQAEEVGSGAGMLVVFMIAGLFLSRKMIPYFAAQHGPTWMQRTIRFGCCVPLLAIGAAPMLDSHNYHEEGLGLLLALALIATFKRWEKSFNRSAEGEMSFGSAIGSAFIAIPVTAVCVGMMEGDPEAFIWIAAGVVGITSLVIQASSWWNPSVQTAGAQPMAAPAQGDTTLSLERLTPTSPLPPFAKPVTDTPQSQGRSPIYSVQETPNHPRTRWGITRAFWGMVSFLSMGGMVALFVLTMLSGHEPHHTMEKLMGLMGCAAMMIFSLRKTTAVKREGFWRESIRPFLISAALFGIGATITAISIEWGHRNEWGQCLCNEDRAGLIVGLVFSSLIFLGLTFFTGRKRKAPQPFYQGTPDSDSAHVQPLSAELPANDHDKTSRPWDSDPAKDQNA